MLDYVPFLFSLATFFLCEDNKPVDLVILYCVVMPFYPSSTKRHETHSLATDFPLFNLDAGSKRGSIPEGRREVASLVVIVLHTHYDSELGDGGHPARALGLRGRPCRQCVTSLADDECVNAARPFLPWRICDHP